MPDHASVRVSIPSRRRTIRFTSARRDLMFALSMRTRTRTDDDDYSPTGPADSAAPPEPPRRRRTANCGQLMHWMTRCPANDDLSRARRRSRRLARTGLDSMSMVKANLNGDVPSRRHASLRCEVRRRVRFSGARGAFRLGTFVKKPKADVDAEASSSSSRRGTTPLSQSPGRVAASKRGPEPGARPTTSHSPY